MGMYDVRLRIAHQLAERPPFLEISLRRHGHHCTLNPVACQRRHKGMLCRVRLDYSNHRHAISLGLLPPRQEPHDALQPTGVRRSRDVQNP